MQAVYYPAGWGWTPWASLPLRERALPDLLPPFRKPLRAAPHHPLPPRAAGHDAPWPLV